MCLHDIFLPSSKPKKHHTNASWKPSWKGMCVHDVHLTSSETKSTQNRIGKYHGKGRLSMIFSFIHLKLKNIKTGHPRSKSDRENIMVRDVYPCRFPCFISGLNNLKRYIPTQSRTWKISYAPFLSPTQASKQHL